MIRTSRQISKVKDSHFMSNSCSKDVAILLKDDYWVWHSLYQSYLSFVNDAYEVNSNGDVWNKQLSCYFKTDETVADELGIPVRTYKRKKSKLLKSGCLFARHSSNVKTDMPLVYLLPLDPFTDDYIPILNEFKGQIEGRLETNTSNGERLREDLHRVNYSLANPPERQYKQVRIMTEKRKGQADRIRTTNTIEATNIVKKDVDAWDDTRPPY